MKRRQSRLGQVRVVGVTCAACVFSIMEKNQFQIVVLDECSQMIEPVVRAIFFFLTCRACCLLGNLDVEN